MTDEPTTYEVFWRRVIEQQPQLAELLDRVNDHWAYEDMVYRFYHVSFKVYYVQKLTEDIVKALRGLAPDCDLNEKFAVIFVDGTGHAFSREHNREWMVRTRPMLEAFFHARFMLEMAVKYGAEFKRLRDEEGVDKGPTMLDSGWAALLYLFDLR